MVVSKYFHKMDEEVMFKDSSDLSFLLNRVQLAYSMYKDLITPTLVWNTSKPKETIVSPEYFPTQTVFLKEPGLQKDYRDKVIENIAEVPSPQPFYLQCDILLQDFLSLKLKSKPEVVRSTLSKFYYKQVKYLQQYKYKYILNWASNSPSSPIKLGIVSEKIRLIDLELLDCIESYDRIKDIDDVPLIKSKQDTFKPEIPLLPKDIEYYIKKGADKLKVNRKIYCLGCKVKWMWVSNRTEIWKRSIILLAELKSKSIERMKLITGQDDVGEQKVVVNLVTNVNLRSLKKQHEIRKRAKADHSTFAEEQKNLNEILKNSHNDEIDNPPLILTTSKQLNGLLDTICQEFKLVGTVDTDDGHALSYQISHLLPELFEIQRKRQDWKYYEPPEKDIASIRMSYIQSIKRGTTMRKLSTEILPHQLSGYKFLKTLSIKDPDWLDCRKLVPEIPSWQQRQNLILKEFNKQDSLLKSSFDMLNVQDLPTISRILEEFSMNYCERASKRGVLKIDLGLSDEDIKKRYFSNLLEDNYSSANLGSEEAVDLPLVTIKGLYTLKFLKSRGLKQKLTEICNFYRSVERRLRLDISYLDSTSNQFSLSQPSGTLIDSLDGEINSYMPSKMPELFGRQDTIEYLEGSVYIIDEAGEYIIYSMAESDMKKILNELLVIGSYYIDKYEVWSEDQGDNFPVIDRDLLTNELLEEEVKFQEIKAKLINDYLEIYKNTVKASQQLEVCQKISDLIAMRPRLHLRGSYFTQSYWAHTKALEQHSMFLRSLLVPALAEANNEIYTEYYKYSEIWDKVKKCIEEISEIHETENLIALSTLEHSVWEHANEIWRSSSSYSSPFDKNLIIDDPDRVLKLINNVKKELSTKEFLPKLTASMFDNKNKVTIVKDMPSELQIMCNGIEVFRLRKYLELNFEENQVLEGIYRKQCLAMKRENVDLEFVNFFPGNPHISNLYDWPGSKPPFKLPAYEITPVLTENLDLKSYTCFENLILPQGLVELKAVTEYQITQKHLLIISTQLNQYLCDNFERQIAEIEIARTLKYIPKKTKVIWDNNVLGRKGEGLIDEKADNEILRLKSKIFSSGELFTDCKKIKLNYRESMKNSYNAILQKYVNLLGEGSPYIGIVSRNLVALLVNGYCREILRDIYTQSIKIHIIKITQELKRLLRIVPEDLIKEKASSQEFFASGFNRVNLKVIPTIEYIIKLPGITQKDVWKNWDPYFSAETPETVNKKIKMLAFAPRSSSQTASNIKTLHEWSFSCDLKLILEALQGYLQTTQIILFTKFLDMKSSDIIYLQETALEGKNYWSKPETKEIGTMNLKAVDGLILEKSPVYLFYNKIKESLEEIESINSQTKEMSIETQADYITRVSNVYYLKLAVIIFEALEKSFENNNESDIRELEAFIVQGFRYTSRTLNLKTFFKNEDKCSDLIRLFEKEIFIDNTPAPAISSAYIKPCDSGFIGNSIYIKEFAYNEYINLGKKLESYAKVKEIKSGVSLLDLYASYMTTILETFRLKAAYYIKETNNELAIPLKLRSKIFESYKNSIGLKASIISSSIREDKYLAKNIAEGKLLKDYLNIALCKVTIEFIHQECTRMIDASKIPSTASVNNEFTCNADRDYNDVTKKIGCLHLYMNNLRNRCTLVEAPTSGKAHVYLIKDMTKLTKKFASNIVKFLETEYRNLEENFMVQSEFFEKVKSQKDQQIESLTKILKNLETNLDNLINSQLSQKGNSLIYELDRFHRKLQEIKANIKLVPGQVRNIVYLDYKEEIETNQRKILDIKQNFNNFKSQLTQELKAEISFHKTSIFTEIKNKTSKSKAKDINGLLEEDITYTKKKEMKDLDSLQKQINKIRFMKIWVNMFEKQKFYKNIKELEKQLTSNQYLWEQLNESQRREALLKQELSYTQQSLASAEKLADKLQTSIEDMNNQRLRLQQYKSNKGKRLNELELRIKQQEKLEHKDNQLLLNQFYIQNEKIQSLQISEEKAGLEYIPHHIRYQKEIHHLKLTLEREQFMKLSAFEELNKYRNDIKSMNKNPESKIKELKIEFHKSLAESKAIKEQNKLFIKKLGDIGDEEFVSRIHTKYLSDDKNFHVSSKDSENSYLNVPSFSRGEIP